MRISFTRSLTIIGAVDAENASTPFPQLFRLPAHSRSFVRASAVMKTTPHAVTTLAAGTLAHIELDVLARAVATTKTTTVKPTVTRIFAPSSARNRARADVTMRRSSIAVGFILGARPRRRRLTRSPPERSTLQPSGTATGHIDARSRRDEDGIVSERAACDAGEVGAHRARRDGSRARCPRLRERERSRRDGLT